MLFKYHFFLFTLIFLPQVERINKARIMALPPLMCASWPLNSPELFEGQIKNNCMAFDSTFHIKEDDTLKVYLQELKRITPPPITDMRILVYWYHNQKRDTIGFVQNKYIYFNGDVCKWNNNIFAFFSKYIPRKYTLR
jgi:hypothetical protein